MAIVPTVLMYGSSTSDASSYNTASVSPVANKLTLLFVTSRFGTGAPNTPTVSGAGMTWTSAVSQISLPNNSRVTIFRSLNSSPSSGALTIDFSGQNQQNCHWFVVSVNGTVTTGTNGADAIVQTGNNRPSDGASSSTITLSAISSPQNAVFGCCTTINTNNISAGSGFTELQEISAERETQIQYQVGTDNTCDWTFSASNDIVSAAVEVKAISSSGFLAFF